MIYWKRETTCGYRPFFVLEVQIEEGDTLEEFREFVSSWVYESMPKPSSRYFRIDWYKGDRKNLSSVVVDGDSQLDCFFSGLQAGELIAKAE